METLWSPWRSKYIQGFKDEDCKNQECFLCKAADFVEMDKELLVVARMPHSLVIMNRYPYNSGHILVAPNRHVGGMEDISSDEMIEIMTTVQQSVVILKTIYKPQGFNIGVNIGRVAGAGVPGHVHFHVVPRWSGDTNFMSVLGEINVVSEEISEARNALAHEFSKVKLHK
ncbi:MAG: HIT domain-containing protein [Ignavibacteria bacterium]|nr:HIT domain-containing protein [Ignavibacteria bacterium]